MKLISLICSIYHTYTFYPLPRFLTVVKGGYVRLRNWSCISQSLSSPKYKDHRPWKDKEKELLVKTKLCWFDEYHPQGCPRPSYLCSYAHGRDELKERPDFKNEVTPLLCT